MIVSWNWLEEYVPLKMAHDELVDRLTMSGLNHESTEEIAGDKSIDLEVTSNRSDCLGHIGVAREIAVLFDSGLTIPSAELRPTGPSISKDFAVSIESPELCYRFTARIVRGVKVAPSPGWLTRRLEAIGVTPVNNIVDISNYVMFECGQPLHIFDLDKIQGKKIIVREPGKGETLLAIDHKTYQLHPGMCVIADANRAIGLGGVMGGADTEVADDTVNLLIEAAHFNPISIRNTARSLNLHSAASHRFERTIDAHNIDWASRRCCELILNVAGGELADDLIDVGQSLPTLTNIELRFKQIERILGIPVSHSTAKKILDALGFGVIGQTNESVLLTPPSWRSDVTREVDLIEEIGRIYGYGKVPDNIVVPMSASHRPEQDRVLARIRNVLTSAGLDEAMTASKVPLAWAESFSPWTSGPALETSQGMLGVLEKASQNVGPVKYMRRSLVPSLLEARRINEYKSNSDIELFETAKVYLPSEKGLPGEPLKIAIVSERSFFEVKGIIESLAKFLNSSVEVETRSCDFDLFDLNQSCELKIQSRNGGCETLGWLGRVSESGKRIFGIRQHVVVAEVDFDVLFRNAVLKHVHSEISPYPAISRDFNFIVDNQVHWADLKSSVTDAAGAVLESIEYKETFRDVQRDGEGKKRLLLSIVLRSGEETLTGDQADRVCQSIVETCRQQHSAELVS